MGSLIVTNVPGKRLIIKKTGCRAYGNSLYYPLNFSVNLELFLKDSLFQKVFKKYWRARDKV